MPASSESIGRQVVSDPHTFRERVPWDVEQVGRIHVPIIDVDVVIGVGVGVDQDKEDDEEEENVGWDLGERLRTIYSKDRGGDKSFDIWSIVRERKGWTMTLNCGIDQFKGGVWFVFLNNNF